MSNKNKKDYEFTAWHKYSDVSPRKLRPFATMIRGRIADEALELLRFLPNKSARLLEAVLKSALGNAEELRSLPEREPVALAGRGSS